MVTSGHQQDGGRVRADAEEAEQARGVGTDQGQDELVEASDLAIKELGSSSELVQRHPSGMAHNVARTRAQPSQVRD
jgi:hypothetical protein